MKRIIKRKMSLFFVCVCEVEKKRKRKREIKDLVLEFMGVELIRRKT